MNWVRWVLLLSLLSGFWVPPARLEANQLLAWGDNSDGQTAVPPELMNVAAISAIGTRSLALQADGTLAAWGYNPGNVPEPPGLTNLVGIACGGEHHLALRADGTVVAWGYNYYGQTNVPAALTNVVAVAAGWSHSLALRSDGTVVAWGYGGDEQTNVPPGLSDVVGIAAGATHSLALRSDGRVIAWGDMTPWGPNTYRRIVVPPDLTHVVAVAGGWDHDLALRADGTVVAWGDNKHGETNVPPGLTDVVAIAASGYHSVALRQDGTVVAWGQEYRAQQWLPAGVPDGLSNVVAIAAGASHTLALVGRGPPSVNLPLVDRQVAQEVGSVVFSAPAVGEWPLSYQWRHDSAAIPGAIGAWLVLSNVPPDQAGLYSVTVSNASGTTTTPGAQLTVSPAFLVQQPKDVVAFLGGQARFEVQAYGVEPFDYQWRFNGVNLEGQTAATLQLDHLDAARAGDYSVELQNPLGSRESGRARLAINNVAAWGAGTPGTRPGVNALPHYGQSTVPAGLTNVVGIAGGPSHSLALREDGTVTGWGHNWSGQAVAPDDLRDVVAVACGQNASLALRSDGTVVTWGAHGPAPVGLSNVVAIAAGEDHYLALRKDGSVLAWGSNLEGQTNVPPGLSNVVTIAAGFWYSLALRADGTVMAWGYHATVPAGLTNVVAVAAGVQNLALKADGTVAVWDSNSSGPATVLAGLSNVVAVAARGGHSLALRADGGLTAWGDSAYGLRTIPAGLTNVTAIACGDVHNLALIGHGPPVLAQRLTDRQVTAEVGRVIFQAQAVGEWPLSFQWQRNGIDIPEATNAWLVLTQVQPEQAGTYTVTVSNAWGTATSSPAELTVAPALITRDPQDQGVLIGRSATLEVRAQGEGPLSYQWRFNGAHLTEGTHATLVLPEVDWSDEGRYSVIVSNRFGTVLSREALLTVCRVAAWGDNSSGQTNVPPGLSSVVAVAGGGEHSLALRSDGTVVAWGSDRFGQTNVPAIATNVVAIAAGWGHCLALRLDGSLVSWGYNSHGQSSVPGGLEQVVGIACGGFHNLALLRGGTVTAWGENNSGVTNVPAGLDNAIAVAAGGAHSLVLRADGTVTAWGNNNGGEWVSGGFRDVAALADGGLHTLVLLSDGTVAAWGANGFGQARPPSSVTNAVAVAAGTWHSLALRADGGVMVWGDGSARQRRMPPGLSNVVSIAAGGYHSLAIVGPPLPLMLTVTPPDTEAPSFRQTGLLWHVVRVFNTTALSFPAVRVVVQALPSNASVYNATGTNAQGQPYVQYNQPLAPGASVDLTIEYFVANRSVPNTTLTVEAVDPAPPLDPTGTPQDITRSLRMADGSYLIDFRTLADGTYYVQYSADLLAWRTAFPPLSGTGSGMQWVDNGPPKTETSPRSQTNRFYRVLLTP